MVRALSQNSYEIAKLLLEKGANYRIPCSDGFSPLVYAIGVCDENANFIELLLNHVEEKYGIEAVVQYVNHPIPDILDSGIPLHHACMSLKYRAAELLLNYHSNINIKNNLGYKACDLIPESSVYDIDAVEQMKSLLQSRMYGSMVQYNDCINFSIRAERVDNDHVFMFKSTLLKFYERCTDLTIGREEDYCAQRPIIINRIEERLRVITALLRGRNIYSPQCQEIIKKLYCIFKEQAIAMEQRKPLDKLDVDVVFVFR